MAKGGGLAAYLQAKKTTKGAKVPVKAAKVPVKGAIKGGKGK